MVKEQTALGYLMAFIVCVVAIFSVANLYEAEDVELKITQEGEGTIDPLPGVYEIESHTYVTITPKAADGYALYSITVNGMSVELINGAMTIFIIGDTEVHVEFGVRDMLVAIDGSADIGEVIGERVVVVKGTTSAEAGTNPVPITMEFDSMTNDTISNTKLTVSSSDKTTSPGFTVDGISTVLDINLTDAKNNPVDTSDLGGIRNHHRYT